LRRQQLADRLITAAVATIVDQQTHTRPRPVLSEVITDMRGYIAEHDGVDLREIPRKELEHMFGVSRDSARRALREIYLDAD
jgi:DNA-binding FadR family transcriptional regulator